MAGSHTIVHPPDIWRMTTKDELECDLPKKDKKAAPAIVTEAANPPSLKEIVDLDNRLKDYDDRMKALEEKLDNLDRFADQEIESLHNSMALVIDSEVALKVVAEKLDGLSEVIEDKSFEVIVNPKIEIPKIDLPVIAGIKLEVPSSLIAALWAIAAAVAVLIGLHFK
jgi:soluble cytochrome b562